MSKKGTATKATTKAKTLADVSVGPLRQAVGEYGLSRLDTALVYTCDALGEARRHLGGVNK